MAAFAYPSHDQPAAGQDIAWRRVTEVDFPLLREWLEHDYVARWWNHETSPEAVARDFGASARGEEPSEDWLAVRGRRPFGLVQRCRIADYPEYADDLAGIVAVPAGAAMLDYLIGEPAAVGRGLGPVMIAAMAVKTWRDWADASAIVVPVVAANRRSWRALEKAGFTRVAEGDLEPDNPVDEPLHYVSPFLSEASPASRGMGSLLDPARIRKVLAESGFTDIEVAPCEAPMTFGANAGDAADFLFSMGPTRYNLRDVDPATITRIRAEVQDALTEFETPDGVCIPGAVWIVTATRERVSSSR